MAEISIRLNTPVTRALDKDPDDLTEEDKQLLRAYNDAKSAKEAELQARIEERDRNYQEAMLFGLECSLNTADETIAFAKKDLTDRKYLNAINDRIYSLEHLRGKDFLWEYREKINNKIKELKMLYASIDK